MVRAHVSRAEGLRFESDSMFFIFYFFILKIFILGYNSVKNIVAAFQLSQQRKKVI